MLRVIGNVDNETGTLPSLALVRRVGADGVVPYELGLAGRRVVLRRASQRVQRRVVGRGGGGRVAEGAGPSAEAWRVSVTGLRGSGRGRGERRVEALQVPC